MSATNRGAVRREHDFYATPAWCVHRLLEAVDLPGGEWLEPAVGDGAIVDAVASVRDDVGWMTCDIRDDVGLRGDVVFHYRGDYVAFGKSARRFDVAITNPPFTRALDFAARMREDADVAVALLRLNWLEGGSRAEWLRANPPDVYVLPNRPSFTGNGTDACAYAWFVWGLTEGGHIRVLRTTPKSERQQRTTPALSPDENAAEARRVIEQLRGKST